MGVIRFYHLTRDSAETALRQLLPRALEAGLRVEVRSPDGAALERLDAALWLGDEAGFLPHGLAGGPHDALQPVLLTRAETAADGTRCVMAVDGAPVAAGEAARLDRVFVIFDGTADGPLAHARGQWAALKAEGAELEYWSQESGRWARKA